MKRRAGELTEVQRKYLSEMVGMSRGDERLYQDYLERDLRERANAAGFGHLLVDEARVALERRMAAANREAHNPFASAGLLNAQQANMYLNALDASFDWMGRLDCAQAQQVHERMDARQEMDLKIRHMIEANPELAGGEYTRNRQPKPRRAITTHDLPRMTRNYRWTA